MSDETTPKGKPLSAKYRNSFAYTTIKDRLPVILSKIADTLCRMKDEVKAEHGDQGCGELKIIIGHMSKLRNEVQTDKPLKPFKDHRTDVDLWNNYLMEMMDLAASGSDACGGVSAGAGAGGSQGVGIATLRSGGVGTGAGVGGSQGVGIATLRSGGVGTGAGVGGSQGVGIATLRSGGVGTGAGVGGSQGVGIATLRSGGVGTGAGCSGGAGTGSGNSGSTGIDAGHSDGANTGIGADSDAGPEGSDGTDADTDAAGGGGGSVSWFTSAWLYVECYMYRRVQETLELTDLLNTLDVFKQQKHNSLLSSQPAVDGLLLFLNELLTRMHLTTSCSSKTELQAAFMQLMQISLWSNKVDLSISAGLEVKYEYSLLDTLRDLHNNILVDDSKAVWNLLHGSSGGGGGGGCECRPAGRVDIVLDNSGYELVTDLCLAEFLISSGLTSTIHLHGKPFPWFVSDTTPQDFHSFLARLQQSNSPATAAAVSASLSDPSSTNTTTTNKVAASFGHRWAERLKNGSWKFVVHDFWTSPFTFDQMKTRCPDLYADIAQSDLIIFKGDLNYRKLVGDINWDTTTPFCDALRGFHPAPLCALRTLKSDTVVGLEEGLETQMSNTDANWLINANWGVISFSDRIS